MIKFIICSESLDDVDRRFLILEQLFKGIVIPCVNVYDCHVINKDQFGYLSGT